MNTLLTLTRIVATLALPAGAALAAAA